MIDVHELLDLYAIAATHADQAWEVVEELIVAVQSGANCESQSALLRTLCGEIAAVDARILAVTPTMLSEQRESGHLLLAAAERHMKALGRLWDRVRDAEQMATLRLQALSPGLDASIRGKAMITAYNERRAS